MADDWQAGDLALCVHNGGWYDIETKELSKGPKQGWVGVVDRLNYGVCPCCDERVDALGFAEYPDDEYAADCFVKIDPLTDDEQREFEADLRIVKRATDPGRPLHVEPVPVLEPHHNV